MSLIQANKANGGVLVERAIEHVETHLGMKPWGNCWGTTSYLKGWQSSEKYIESDTMIKRLEKACKVARPKFGDVVAIWANAKGARMYWEQEGNLLHTAVYVGRGRYLHQEGMGGEMRIDTLKHIKSVYPGSSSYHR